MSLSKQALVNILHSALDGEILSDVWVETMAGENELIVWTGEDEDRQTFVLSIDEEDA